MGTFSRLRYVIAANVNSLIEKAEDPEKLLRALIREMEDAGEETRVASAELLAEQQHLQRTEKQLAGEVAQWQARAERAVQEGRDDLARSALKARTEVMARHTAVTNEQTLVDERIEQLNRDVQTLKSKLAEAKLKLKSGYSHSAAAKSASGISQPKLSPYEKRVRRALGRFDRLQTQVENLEARVRSYETGGPVPSVWDSEAGPVDPSVESDLEQLKERLATEAKGSEAIKSQSGMVA